MPNKRQRDKQLLCFRPAEFSLTPTTAKIRSSDHVKGCPRVQSDNYRKKITVIK